VISVLAGCLLSVSLLRCEYTTYTLSVFMLFGVTMCYFDHVACSVGVGNSTFFSCIMTRVSKTGLLVIYYLFAFLDRHHLKMSYIG
jgi:hypothetical protein